jgi:hypothetical protein
MRNVTLIRRLIAEGLSDAEIEQELYEAAADEAEARDRELEDDYEHEADYRWHAHNDRLDMGRNDAGEWLGFM